MAKFKYLTSKEMYEKLKNLLALDITFSDKIKSQYFCIYGKSRILAIKVSTTWFVNIDNWSIKSADVLEKLQIKAITPGSYALNELKLSLRESRHNYNSLWPQLKTHLNKIIKSGYNSGLLYAAPGFYDQTMYHYDINSAYAEAFLNAEVPVGLPEIVPKFIPPDKEHLNLYMMDLNVEYNSQTIFPYLVNSGDVNKMPSQVIDNTGMQSLYKVITQTEYLDLKKDYDVIDTCLYTVRFKKKSNLFNNFINRFYELKESTKDDERMVYKSILASLAGKLGQGITRQQIPTEVNAFGHIQYRTITIPEDDVIYINPAVSLFIVDHVRKKLRDTIKKVGYKNVVLADTDGFISKVPINLPLSKKIGEWKLSTYKNIIVNGKRSYFYTTEDGQFHSSISGLGDIHDDEINVYDFQSIKMLHELKNTIPVIKKVTYCGQDKYVSMNINVGDK